MVCAQSVKDRLEMSFTSAEDIKENVPPAKRFKADSLEKETKDEAVRTFKVKSLGGEVVEVKIPGRSDVGALEAAVAKEKGLGLCFTLIDADGQQLNNISAPLPMVSEVSCQVENPFALCKAAQEVLKKAKPHGKEDADLVADLRLGRCRTLGGPFSGSRWKKGGIDSAISDIEVDSGDETDEEIDMYGSYDVYELTIIDGNDKRHRLIGVINGGDADANTGMWGSVYLRPAFQEVGKLRSNGDCESVWTFEDDASWYKDPPFPGFAECGNRICGGGENAKTPLQHHLAHALEKAFDKMGGAMTDDDSDEQKDDADVEDENQD